METQDSLVFQVLLVALVFKEPQVPKDCLVLFKTRVRGVMLVQPEPQDLPDHKETLDLLEFLVILARLATMEHLELVVGLVIQVPWDLLDLLVRLGSQELQEKQDIVDQVG